MRTSTWLLFTHRQTQSIWRFFSARRFSVLTLISCRRSKPFVSVNECELVVYENTASDALELERKQYTYLHATYMLFLIQNMNLIHCVCLYHFSLFVRISKWRSQKVVHSDVCAREEPKAKHGTRESLTRSWHRNYKKHTEQTHYTLYSAQ